jgi:hypothetical protein
MCKKCFWYYDRVKRLNIFGCFDWFIDCRFFGYLPRHLNFKQCRGCTINAEEN